jgi:hypothetical protein
VRYQAALHSDITTDLGQRTGLIGALVTRCKRRAPASDRARGKTAGPPCSLDQSRAKLQTFESGRIPAARRAQASGADAPAIRSRGSRLSFRLKPLAPAVALIASAGTAVPDDLKVALIYRLTGHLQAYANRRRPALSSGSNTQPGERWRSTGARSSSSPRTTRASPISPKARTPKRMRTTAPTSQSGRPPPPLRLQCCLWLRSKKDPHRRACGRRPDHRRQVEPIYLSHSAQLHSGRDLQRFGDR